MSKITHTKCGDCRHYFKCDSACENDYACADFKRQGKTLFDRITASPEVLAPFLTYAINNEWYSTVTDRDINPDGGYYHTEAEAIAATVAKLKEVEK